jgi:hypothetical protein
LSRICQTIGFACTKVGKQAETNAYSLRENAPLGNATARIMLNVSTIDAASAQHGNEGELHTSC